jgi:hypothetical protein
MDNSGREDRPWIWDYFYSNSYNVGYFYYPLAMRLTGMQDQTSAECCPLLLSTHDSGLSGGHDQGVNSTEVTSIAYPSASVPGPPRSYLKTCEEGSSFYFHQQGLAHALPPQVPSYNYTSQVPSMVSDNVYCGSGGHRGTGAYPARAPAEQWDAQVSWRYTFRLTRSLIPHPYDTGGPATDVFPSKPHATAICRTRAAEE